MFGFFKRRRRLKSDDLATMLAGCVLKSGVTAKVLEFIPLEERSRLGSPSRLEAQILDLWIVNEAFIRSARNLSDAQIQGLINGYHFDVYTHLALNGYTDDDLKELQALMRIRYPQYGEALDPVLVGASGAPLRLARTISRNLFKGELSDPATALALAGRLAATLFAVNDLIREALPRVQWE